MRISDAYRRLDELEGLLVRAAEQDAFAEYPALLEKFGKLSEMLEKHERREKRRQAWEQRLEIENEIRERQTGEPGEEQEAIE